MFKKETCRDRVHCLKIISSSSSFNKHIYMCVCARALQNRNTGFICLVIGLQFSVCMYVCMYVCMTGEQ